MKQDRPISPLLSTTTQVHTWLVDVNQFVDEDENEFSYSVRLSACELLQVGCPPQDRSVLPTYTFP